MYYNLEISKKFDNYVIMIWNYWPSLQMIL